MLQLQQQLFGFRVLDGGPRQPEHGIEFVQFPQRHDTGIVLAAAGAVGQAGIAFVATAGDDA